MCMPPEESIDVQHRYPVLSHCLHTGFVGTVEAQAGGSPAELLRPWTGPAAAPSMQLPVAASLEQLMPRPGSAATVHGPAAAMYAPAAARPWSPPWMERRSPSPGAASAQPHARSAAGTTRLDMLLSAIKPISRSGGHTTRSSAGALTSLCRGAAAPLGACCHHK